MTIARYADGSVTVATLTEPNNAPHSPSSSMPSDSVSECTLTSGSNYHANYTGCLARVDKGAVMMGFHFDRETNPGGRGRITKYYGHHNRVIGGVFSNDRLEQFNPQTVRYSAEGSVVFKGFPAGTTAWVQVELGDGTDATVTFG